MNNEEMDRDSQNSTNDTDQNIEVNNQYIRSNDPFKDAINWLNKIAQ